MRNNIVLDIKGTLEIMQEYDGVIGRIGPILHRTAINTTIWGKTEKEVKANLKEALEGFALNWLRSQEIHRVYSTRYDCFIEPERVRLTDKNAESNNKVNYVQLA